MSKTKGMQVGNRHSPLSVKVIRGGKHNRKVKITGKRPDELYDPVTFLSAGGGQTVVFHKGGVDSLGHGYPESIFEVTKYFKNKKPETCAFFIDEYFEALLISATRKRGKKETLLSNLESAFNEIVALCRNHGLTNELNSIVSCLERQYLFTLRIEVGAGKITFPSRVDVSKHEKLHDDLKNAGMIRPMGLTDFSYAISGLTYPIAINKITWLKSKYMLRYLLDKIGQSNWRLEQANGSFQIKTGRTVLKSNDRPKKEGYAEIDAITKGLGLP